MTSNAEKKDNGREMTTLLSREKWDGGQRQAKRRTGNIITLLHINLFFIKRILSIMMLLASKKKLIIHYLIL